MKVRKQAGWSRFRPQLFHFRTSEGHEVDLVLEDPRAGLVGIEVKARASVGPADLRGLRMLSEVAGARFRRGVVLYTGAEIVPFGANLHAVPVQAVWEWRE